MSSLSAGAPVREVRGRLLGGVGDDVELPGTKADGIAGGDVDGPIERFDRQSAFDHDEYPLLVHVSVQPPRDPGVCIDPESIDRDIGPAEGIAQSSML